jgi:hypothetical protein
VFIVEACLSDRGAITCSGSRALADGGEELALDAAQRPLPLAAARRRKLMHTDSGGAELDAESIPSSTSQIDAEEMPRRIGWGNKKFLLDEAGLMRSSMCIRLHPHLTNPRFWGNSDGEMRWWRSFCERALNRTISFFFYLTERLVIRKIPQWLLVLRTSNNTNITNGSCVVAVSQKPNPTVID